MRYNRTWEHNIRMHVPRLLDIYVDFELTIIALFFAVFYNGACDHFSHRCHRVLLGAIWLYLFEQACFDQRDHHDHPNLESGELHWRNHDDGEWIVEPHPWDAINCVSRAHSRFDVWRSDENPYPCVQLSLDIFLYRDCNLRDRGSSMYLVLQTHERR